MVKNSFVRGPQGWCSYDYHASVASGGRNIFILATWERQGGPNDAGYVWTDNTRWSADTPEKPLSILPLIFYRSWVDAGPLDLCGAEVSFYLRGDGVRLDGAQCLFWIHGGHTRWHCTSQPLVIGESCWPAEPCRFALPSEEDRWHCSWSMDPDHPAPLAELLRRTESYGFSFTGFSAEVTGRLSLAEFEISRPVQ